MSRLPRRNTGDVHEIPAEVDNWDLRDHCREGTHVQNRRNVQVGSLINQQQPRPDKDSFTRVLVSLSGFV
jgi:hypothetical protein